MKHTLEEIEKMLSEISPWPWGYGFNDGVNIIVLPHSATEGSLGVAPVPKDGDEIYCSPYYGQAPGGDFKHTPLSLLQQDENAKFIAASPQIIFDLVNECRNNEGLKLELKQLRKTLGEIKEDFIITKILQEEAKQYNEENQILRKALKFYANMEQESDNNFGHDENYVSLKVAREALEAK